MSDKLSEQDFLAQYDIRNYDIPLVTVDMSIFTVRDGALQVLLVKRREHPCLGNWALPGGFVDTKQDRNLDDTAHRKLLEKTGIDSPYLEQVASLGSASRDPRGWSVTVSYFALINSDEVELQSDPNTEQVSWVPVAEVRNKYALAFDHQEILETCFDRLKSKVRYTSLPVHLLPDTFTLTELQSTFELLLEKPLEKKSFRRRVLDANILEETGESRKGSNRPAKLYRAKANKEEYYFDRNIEGSRV